MSASRYRDRADAGAVLAAACRTELGTDARPVVLALPRGGVPVAVPVATEFGTRTVPLWVRKLGHPGQPEYAIGAVAALGDRVEVVENPDGRGRSGVDEAAFQRVLAAEREVLITRQHDFADAPVVDVADRTVLLVDDGLATGSTALAAVAALRQAGAGPLLVAVPVAPRAALDAVGAVADGVVCPYQPTDFTAVGQAYADFDQVSDASVRRLLTDAG